MKIKRKEYKRIIRALLSDNHQADETDNEYWQRQNEKTKQYEKSIAIKHRSDQDQRMLEAQALLLDQQRAEIADLEKQLAETNQLYIDLLSTPEKENRYFFKTKESETSSPFDDAD